MQTEWDDITSLVDHVVGRCHQTTRRALADASTCADVRVAEALRTFGTQLEAQLVADEALFGTIRALAEARAGRGPFPPAPFTAVHSHGHHVQSAHAKLNDTLQRIRMLAQSSSSATIRALDALVIALAHETHLVTNELLPWAQNLEPDREHAHHHTAKRHANGHTHAKRRANELHTREVFAVARDFIHRKRA